MLTNRQKLILKAIVEEYVKTNEPVGSKTLIERPEFMLNYSSATIRNEMMELEEMGYLLKTHTSSGRIPSDEGYRFYVKEALYEKEFNNEDYEFNFPDVDEIIEHNMLSREQAIKESVSLISKFTNYTSIVMGPSALNARIRKLQFVSISGRYAVVLMVTDKGDVESKKIIVPETLSPSEIEKIINFLNEALYDCPISKIDERMKEIIKNNNIRDFISYYDELIGAFIETFTKMAKDDYFLTGQNKLINFPEFQDLEKIQDLMLAIENQEVTNAIVKEMNTGLSVKIGNDNTIQCMKDCSVITVPYEDGNGNYGKIAVIGPTRMEYNKIIPLLEYIANSIKKI